ncbi:MAG: metallophosphoesterase family protein [Candidatus Hadarchaeales archaeon]
MRLLVVADLHGQPVAQHHLIELLGRGFEGVVLIGDLSHLGPVGVIEDLLNTVQKSNIPVLSVPGNCDPKNTDQVLEARGVNLHKKCIKLGNLTFIGLGGSNVTPFNTPLEFTEAEITEELEKLVEKAGRNFILVTHAPPFGTPADMLPDGTHIGSKSIRAFIERTQPIANCCGHVHEGRSISHLGSTLVVNPGPLSKGYAAELKVGEKTEATLIQL